MESYLVLKDLAIIIIAAKLFGIIARKLKAPQVVGEIIAGLIIGPSILGWVNQTDFLIQMAEIGVIFLMFSAGLETDLKELVKTGPIAALIACAGVFIPLILGAGYYMLFYGVSPWGSLEFYKAVLRDVYAVVRVLDGSGLDLSGGGGGAVFDVLHLAAGRDRDERAGGAAESRFARRDVAQNKKRPLPACDRARHAHHIGRRSGHFPVSIQRAAVGRRLWNRAGRAVRAASNKK